MILICGERSITILVFILDYFQEKPIPKFFKKSKTLLWCHFGQFLPKFGEKSIFLEKVLSVFKYSNYLPWYRNQSLMVKCWWTDRQTENSNFIGPSIGQGTKKSNLEQNAVALWCSGYHYCTISFN